MLVLKIMKEKICDLLLLPDRGPIYSTIDNKISTDPSERVPGILSNNLYVLSDDKIRLGDWCVESNHGFNSLVKYNINKDINNLKKVIATTNTKSFIVLDENIILKRIPYDFLRYYCSVNGLKTALVEYNIIMQRCFKEGFESDRVPTDILKFNLNNEIFIKSLVK